MTLSFSPASPSPPLMHRALGYAAVPVTLAVAMALRYALEAGFGSGLPPYIAFYPMVMAVAILAGFWPGVLATAGASGIAVYWILPQRGPLLPIDEVGVALFITTGLFISKIADFYRQHRAQAAARDLEAQRRSTEEALRQSEERWRFALEISELGAWELNLADHTVWRTLRHDQIFGYPEMRPEWTLEMALQHVLEEDRPVMKSSFQRALVQSTDWRFTVRIRRADGCVRWICCYGKSISGPDGRPARLFGLVADITARKEDKQKLRHSEALYRAIGESLDYGVWACAPDGRNTYISPSFLKMVGMTQRQCSDFGWGDALHPDDAAPTLAAWRECVQSGGLWNHENRVRSADGDWRHVLSRGVPVRDDEGHISCWAGINLDITALKQVQEEVRANEQRLRLATEATGVGVWEWNVHSHEARWNAQMFRLYGFAPTADGYVHYCDWSRAVLPEDLPAEKEILEETLRQGGYSKHNFHIRHALSGEIRSLQTVQTVRMNADGQPGWVLGTNLDITDHKRAEEKLQAAMAEANRANHAKSRFLAAASHDLRQPLSALRIYADLLKNAGTPTDRQMVANMHECIVSLSALLNDLLDLSKLEAAVVHPCFSAFPLAAMLASLEAGHALEAQAKGLRLRCRASPLTAHSDPVLFKRLLNNLLSNAIRYTEKGGVLVACRHRQGKTWVEVWDTGIGIAADKTTEIFEEFSQLGDGSRSRGSGLGLAIVAKMATLLGLEISVRSRPGRGSVFAVEMPLGDAVSVLPAPAPYEGAAAALRIALVEDNPMVREALVAGLQRLGHQVVAGVSRTALLAALDQSAPDIVVADYRLTGGDTGYDIITLLRARFGAELPAILITGDTDPELLNNMSARGIVVLHKPIDMETLQAYLEDLACRVKCRRRRYLGNSVLQTGYDEGQLLSLRPPPTERKITELWPAGPSQAIEMRRFRSHLDRRPRHPIAMLHLIDA